MKKRHFRNAASWIMLIIVAGELTLNIRLVCDNFVFNLDRRIILLGDH